MIEKHSITIMGHRTSVTLESEFWNELKNIAKRQNKSISQIIANIDEERKYENLSSNIRVFVLETLKSNS